MLRRNVANQHLGLCLVNAATGAPLTGAAVTALVVVDGAAQATAGGAVTERGFGQYSFAPTQADTDGNQISYLFLAAGAVPVEKTVVTTAADPTDAQRFGLAALPAAFTLSVDAAGRVTLAPAGLDAVAVEAGLNMRQAQSIVAAACAGALTGQDTNAPVLKGAGVSATRVTMTTDANGNRSAVVLSPPA